MDGIISGTPFICPVCGEELLKKDNVCVCENRHSFDIARSGYVNLLMSSQRAKQHGDDKAMISARADFLNRGFYDPLSEKICGILKEYCGKSARVLDAGCGECKYTADIYDALGCDVIGIDISKRALSAAHRRARPLHLAVASTAEMPIASGSIDAVVNVFAPFAGAEFSRVLKKDGIVVRVYPLARHLWELKTLVYEKAYENPVCDMNEPALELYETHEVCFKMKLESNEDIKSLFAMTPYYYRTASRDMAKLESVDFLVCSAEFGIAVYKKK